MTPGDPTLEPVTTEDATNVGAKQLHERPPAKKVAVVSEVWNCKHAHSRGLLSSLANHFSPCVRIGAKLTGVGGFLIILVVTAPLEATAGFGGTTVP